MSETNETEVAEAAPPKKITRKRVAKAAKAMDAAPEAQPDAAPEARPAPKKRTVKKKASEGVASEAAPAAEAEASAKKPRAPRKTKPKTENPETVPCATAQDAPPTPAPSLVQPAPESPASFAPSPRTDEWSPGAKTGEPAAQGQPQPYLGQQRPQQHQRPPYEQRQGRHDRRDKRGKHGKRWRDRRDRDGGGGESGYGHPQQGYGQGPAPYGGGEYRYEQTSEPEAPAGPPEYSEGLVEVSGKGFGFLREPGRGYAQHPSDVFVTPEVCRKYSLRDGQWVKGEIRRGQRGMQLYKLTEIDGEDPEKCLELPSFDELTVINPIERIRLETSPDRMTTRVIDMMAPIGKGQRGLIVAPPRTGKTTLLEHMAEAVATNYPEMKLILLLVDERPEEVTQFKRTCPTAEIMASSNDSDVKSHCRIAQLAIERAKRLVEMGHDVFILLDSLTRVGRAFNNAMHGSGRTLSGGMDARAMEIPRRLFAAARNTEEAGSLTIIATALVETGSRMDELIFQEFKGTGNMELALSRQIADMRVYPAVDIFLSGTRREELLIPAHELAKISVIRRGLSGHKPIEAIERLLSFLRRFPTNEGMLRSIPAA